MGVIKTVDYIGGERYFTLKIEVPTRVKTYHGGGWEVPCYGGKEMSLILEGEE